MPNTEDKGRQASIEGFANEHIVAGLLMKKYTLYVSSDAVSRVAE